MELSLGIFFLLIEIFLIGVLVPVLWGKGKKMNMLEVFLMGLGVCSVVGLIFFHFNIFQYCFVALILLAALSLFLLVIKKTVPISFEEPIKWSEIAILVSIIGVSIFLRFPLSNFIFDIGDAGVYINSANSLAKFGYPYSEFFPMMQIWLGFFSFLLGGASTMYGSLFFSIVTAIVFYHLLREIFDDKKLAIVGMFLFSVNILSIWMAKMPYSEILMLLENVSILWVLIRIHKLINRDNSLKNTQFLTILLLLLIFITTLTRITAVLWMVIMSGSLVLNLLLTRVGRKLHYAVFNLAFLVYGLGVVYLLLYRKGYYVDFNLGSYVEGITPFQIIVAHILWWCAISLLYLFTKKDRTVLTWLKGAADRFEKNIQEKTKTLILAVIILIGIISFGEWMLFIGHHLQSISIIAFFPDLVSGQIGTFNPAYHLFNYFSYSAFILVPVGLVLFLKDHNFLRRKELTPLWVFIVLIMAFYLSWGDGATLSHTFYLYYDRYLYSELFVVYMLFMVASMFFLLHKNKIIRGFFCILLLIYIAHTSLWWSKNREFTFLGNGYETIERIAAMIPLKNDAVAASGNNILLLNREKELEWFFPNFKRTILLPLKYSFGYNVYTDELDPFGNDEVITEDTIRELVQQYQQVYVLNLSREKDISVTANEPSNIIKTKVDSFSTRVDLKRHTPGNIFKSEIENYYLHVSIEKFYFEKLFPLYGRDEGFYSDSLWTDGEGILDNVNITLGSRDTLVVTTRGAIPYKNDFDALQLKVFVDNIPMDFEKQAGDSYYFTLSNADTVINQIRIESATFVPQEIGIGNDTRRLGIDVDSITFQ